VCGLAPVLAKPVGMNCEPCPCPCAWLFWFCCGGVVDWGGASGRGSMRCIVGVYCGRRGEYCWMLECSVSLAQVIELPCESSSSGLSRSALAIEVLGCPSLVGWSCCRHSGIRFDHLAGRGTWRWGCIPRYAMSMHVHNLRLTILLHASINIHRLANSPFW